MVKFENTSVFNFDGAVRGMRNPLDSWAKSDSSFVDGKFVIGDNDKDLIGRLIAGGSEHRKMMRQIFVCTDIVAPRFWWSEFDTYKVGTTSNSCSTMHKIMSYEFGLAMFDIEPNRMDYRERKHWEETIVFLNDLRNRYRTETNNEIKNNIFLSMKRVLPESFLQRRTITMNYENVYNMRKQRSGHRLEGWSKDFMNWSDNLPYSKLFFKE